MSVSSEESWHAFFPLPEHSEDEETPEPSEDADSERMLRREFGYTTLAEFYDAIFREFIPLDGIPPQVYLDFVQVHYRHTPRIMTLAAFRAHFDDVVRALDEHNFIDEYEQMFPDRPHTSTYECKRNLEGLRDAIEALGSQGVNHEMDLIYSLHTDSVDVPRNIRSPIETDLMQLVCGYIPRRPLANIHTQPGVRRPDRRFFTDRTHTEEDKENVRPRTPAPTRPTTPTPARPTTTTPTRPAQPRPPAHRARMTVSELLTQLRTLQDTP